MQATVYAHRIKAVLQHSVVELGLTLSIDDESAQVSLSQNEATLRDVAKTLGIQIDIQKSTNATTVTFYR
ncbi:hypothetical protein [Litoreibacter albidus]|uniref:Uncharacterized protein n=1 Tax=Litoreibacter albidus TaxID=670155 RepID=A0A1H2V9J1_9RHOB|nr:hypothetical protein [Litoreibacter albidus]SDW64983.1 hypothetical protein SAMN04488001_1451 [Litoreibacter albidus]